MESYLRKLIDEGENQQLDFKYCVSDSRKIARTLAAFANTDGGRLLIGIRDNGSVAGIRSEEELYMVDTAVHLYCNPEVPFTTRQHNTGNRTILEVIVPRGENRPYRVKDESGRWITYFRHGAQNLVAGRVLLEVWRKERTSRGVMVKFGKAENILMEYLAGKGSVTVSMFRKIAAIPARRAEAILANLILFRVIIMKASEKGVTYELNPEEPVIDGSQHTAGRKIKAESRTTINS